MRMQTRRYGAIPILGVLGKWTHTQRTAELPSGDVPDSKDNDDTKLVQTTPMKRSAEWGVYPSFARIISFHVI